MAHYQEKAATGLTQPTSKQVTGETPGTATSTSLGPFSIGTETHKPAEGGVSSTTSFQHPLGGTSTTTNLPSLSSLLGKKKDEPPATTATGASAQQDKTSWTGGSTMASTSHTTGASATAQQSQREHHHHEQSGKQTTQSQQQQQQQQKERTVEEEVTLEPQEFRQTTLTETWGTGQGAVTVKVPAEASSGQAYTRKCLDGKVAVITGGTSGIGLATARLFREEGARVVVTAKCTEKECANIKERCEHEEGFEVVPTDVRTLDEIDKMYRQIQSKFGGIDILFANAGVALFRESKAVDEKFFDSVMDTNVKGVFFSVSRAIPFMNEGSTVIINSSNINAMGWPGGSVYAASKAAVRSFARSWTLEVPPNKVRFNVLSPGAVKTRLMEAMGETEEQRKEVNEAMLNRIPAKRFAEPEEMAKVALFLATPDSSYIVGAEITADGGWTQT